MKTMSEKFESDTLALSDIPRNIGEGVHIETGNITISARKEGKENVGDTATVTTATTATSGSDSSGGNLTKDAIRMKIDLTEVAGRRLYHQAVEQSKKLENMRAKEMLSYKAFCKTRPKLGFDKENQRKKVFRKVRPSLAPVSEAPAAKEEKKPASKEEVVRGKKCAQRLYGLSKRQQELGKQRREEIAEKLRKKNSLPQNRDYGTLSPSRASDMYLKGKRKQQQREAHLQSLRKRLAAQIKKNQEFSLAKGAFAKCDDPDFQERIHMTRYGNLVQFAEEEETDAGTEIADSTIASQSVFTNFPNECDAVDRVPGSVSGCSDSMSYLSYAESYNKYPNKLQQARDLLIANYKVGRV
jgi:hypothetical protein